MSRIVATLVYSKQAGSMARKAVLAYFADRANDDGTGVWTAKQRIADEIECSKQTVITVVKSLIEDGLLVESGRRPNGNGYTVEYAINLGAVSALPDSKREPQEVQILTGPEFDGSNSQTPRGQAALPKPSLNRPIPTKASPSPVARARKGSPSRLQEDWAPTAIDELYAKGRGFGRSQIADIADDFRTYWTLGKGRGTAHLDWGAAWRTWVRREKPRPCSEDDAPAAGSAGVEAKPDEAPDALRLRQAIAEAVGDRTYASWIAPLSIRFDGDRVSLVAGTSVAADHIRNNLGAHIQRVSKALFAGSREVIITTPPVGRRH